MQIIHGLNSVHDDSDIVLQATFGQSLQRELDVAGRRLRPNKMRFQFGTYPDSGLNSQRKEKRQTRRRSIFPNCIIL